VCQSVIDTLICQLISPHAQLPEPINASAENKTTKNVVNVSFVFTLKAAGAFVFTHEQTFFSFFFTHNACRNVLPSYPKGGESCNPQHKETTSDGKKKSLQKKAPRSLFPRAPRSTLPTLHSRRLGFLLPVNAVCFGCFSVVK